jgi:UDP-4-amino-4,6-dideoxy-N-acetyl-beta-L-altrosamine transaminase
MLPYGRQDVTQADIDLVSAVLRSDFLTQGPMVPRFEASVTAYCGSRYGVAVNSATSALHIACLALGLGPGDWLWTSPITFVASANCARYCGASVDFVDIDADTYNMSPVALEAKLEMAEKTGRLPKIVVPVHLTGQSCDMRAIHALSRKYGFAVIEDASHAIGASYLGQQVGDCRFSDITVFSFHPVKIITTAEGGLAATNDAALAERLALFRSHGITRAPARMTREPDGPWYYEQIELGYNYRLTDLQAALGVSQIARLDEYVVRRRTIAAHYDAMLSDLPLTLPYQRPEQSSAWHLYVVRLREKEGGVSHGDLFAHLRASGIEVNLHYIPVHTQPYYRALGPLAGYTDDSFPEALRYYAEAISIPMYATLDVADQDRVCAALRSGVAR